ncbi:MAG: hypothetical protein DRP66_01050 [Planctomycetota bacterium]|nr:MAG: hypothetical protein DRP66_01050 [Planctomycetota bacterium]
MNRLKAKFHTWTIRTKLTLIMMATSAVAVGVGCAIFAVFTAYVLRQEHVRDLHNLADVIGRNSQAALKFDIPEDAARNLATLETDESIVFACIFDLQGRVLAIYRQQGQPESLAPPVLKPEGHEFDGPILKIFEDVEMNGEVIARLCIQDDRREEKAQLGRSIATMFMVMAVSLLAAYLISWRLQRPISRPILSLAATAADIAARKDYSIRAVKESEDEIGTLIDSFNDMLAQIQRNEEVIRTSEEHFRDFFQNAPIGFHIFGPNRLIIDINEAELAMTGYERDEIVNKKTWADLVVDEQQEMFEQHWKDIITSGEARNLEYTVVHKDGHHVDVVLNASARFDEEGNLINTRGSVLDISERKRMTAQVRQSQQMLKTVLDTIAVRVFWKDTDLNFLGCNQLFADDGGVARPEEIIGKSDFDMAWKAQAESYRRDDRQVMESGESKLNYEEPQTTPEGRNIWLSTSKIPLRDDKGDIIGMLGTYEDITDRKRADLALRLSEQRFRAIADYTYNWELWISPTGGVLWTNPAVERITGYSVAECMAMTDYLGSLVVEEDRAMAMEAKEKGLKEERGRMECRIRRKDGKVIWVASSWQPIYDNKGVWQGQRVSVRDITDRKNAEERLAESRERFRSLVETTSDWIWETDRDGVYTYVSPKVKDLLGYDPDELLGKTPFDNMPSEEAARVSGVLEEIRLAQKPFQAMENVNLHKDGRKVILETSGVPVYDAYGNFCGYRGIGRDITDRKRLLQILEAKNRELESIVYTSSHDLRSTIVNVQGFSSELSVTCEHLLGLLEDIPLPHEKLKEELTTILQEEIPTELKYIATSANKMDMLIKGLLKLSRLGQVEMKMEHIDMNALMTEVIDSMQYQIQQAGAEVRVDRLPDCMADAGQMTQIFWNLIDNALKYRDSERQCTIEISGSVKEDMSVYCVADNGCGIPPRHQKNIFEVFHRLEPEGAVGGEGLGLSIIRRIIDRHGGEVRVESAAGQGSRFFVSVPTSRKISIG